MARKGQSAMEYLMTYGWAILIVIIVAAALYALGIFDPSTYTQSTATGFQGFKVSSGAWRVNDTGVVLVLGNMAGSNINVTNITATYAGSTTTAMTPYASMIPSNGQQTFYVSGFNGPSSGSSYSINVQITYDNLNSGLTGFKSSGTITGIAS